MLKYRFARVRCICGKVVNVARYTSPTRCECGAQLRTERAEDDNEQPVAEFGDGYPYDGNATPRIVGWASK